MIRKSRLSNSRNRNSSTQLFQNGEKGCILDPSDLTVEKVNFSTNWLYPYSNNLLDTSSVASFATASLSSGLSFSGEKIIPDNGVALDSAKLTIITGHIPVVLVVRAKSAENTVLRFACGAFNNIWFDLANGTTSSSSSNSDVGIGFTGIEMVSAGSGYYDCKAILMPYYYNSTEIRCADSMNSTGGTGNGVNGLLISRVQVNRGNTWLEYERNYPARFLTRFPQHKLFVDSAGTDNPLIRIGNKIGKIYDSSPNACHFNQATTTKQPILDARINLLPTTSLTIMSTLSSTNLTVYPAMDVIGPTGLYNTWRCKAATSSVTMPTSNAIATSSTLTFSVYTKKGTRTTAPFMMRNMTTSTNYDIGTINYDTGTISGTGWTISAVGNGWFYISYTKAGITQGNSINCYLGANATSVTVGSTWYIAQPQLQVGSNNSSVTGYQDVISDNSGGLLECVDIGALRSIKFDGVDDCLVSTSSVDLTSGNELTCMIGIRKVSDVSQRCIIESSTSSTAFAGAFGIFAPSTNNAGDVQYYARGTNPSSNVYTNSSVAAPNKFVMYTSSKISTDRNVIGINTTSTSTSASDYGTGNFGNYTIYIGQRGSTTIPFNGYIYGIIIVNKILSDDTAKTNIKWMNIRTGAFY